MKAIWVGVMACCALIFAGSASSNSFQGETFFPDLVFDPDKESNEFTAKWYGDQLEAMHQISLWKLSKKDRLSRGFRFLWLPTFDHPVCVRLIQSGDSIEARSIRLDGQGGFEPGKISARKTIKLSQAQIEGLKSRLENSAFWQMDTNRKLAEGEFGILDGDELVLEGIKDGKYHIVHRDEADPKYLELCRYILFELSGFDESKAWKNYHE